MSIKRVMPQFSPYQNRVLLVLTLINFINWIDRQVVYPLMPLIRDEFRVTYTELGWLAAAFSLVHAFGTLGLSRLADLTSRKKVISYGVLFWSGATFLSGLAASFRSLLTARAMVGVGEAAYTPAAGAIISESFSRKIRARVQGVFDLGMFIGGALGLALGAILGQWVGWRPAFFIVGVPGLLLALSILRLPEPPRAPSEKKFPMRDLLQVPVFLLVLVSGWFIAFAGHAYVIWGTDFVYRYKGFSLREAGIVLGAGVVIAGALGVVSGAAVADRLAQAFPWGRALTPAIGFLISAPLIFAALHASAKVSVLAYFLIATFFMTWYHGPLTAVVHDLTPPRAHATAMGVYFFLVNLCATPAASLLIGKIADRYSLGVGLHFALAAQVVGGLGFLGVVHLIRRDRLAHPALDRYRSEPATVVSAPQGVPVATSLTVQAS